MNQKNDNQRVVDDAVKKANVGFAK